MQPFARRVWLALLLVLGLVLATAGVVWAAGESLSRTAVLSAAGSTSSDGLTLRSAVGQPVAGTTSQGSMLLCSGVACSTASETVQPPGTVTVTVADNTFSPDSITIDIGDTVVWVWAEGTLNPHNVVSDDGVTFSSGAPVSSRAPFSHTFTQPGTFGYHCAVHGSPGFGMHGTVIVRSAPVEAQKIYLPLVVR